jgi:hypothetical protein
MSLALALVMCLTLCIPAFASEAKSALGSEANVESKIQSEIQAREQEQLASVYDQLKAQDALKFYKLYSEIINQQIKGEVQSEYGITQGTRAQHRYNCAHGAAVTYHEPNSNCDVGVTYDRSNSYYYILNGRDFTCESILNDIIGSQFPQLLCTKVFAGIFAFASFANSISMGSISKADGFANIINTYDCLDGTHASVVLGWNNHTYITVPSGATNERLSIFNEHDPW